MKKNIILILSLLFLLFYGCSQKQSDIGAKADLLFVTKDGEGIGEYIYGDSVKSDKSWNLWCDKGIDISMLDRERINVSDAYGNKISVTLSASFDGRLISISPPSSGYAVGERYTLTLAEDTVLEGGTVLSGSSVVHFYIEGKVGTKISPEHITVDPHGRVHFSCENAVDWRVASFNGGSIDKIRKPASKDKYNRQNEK